MGQTSRKEMKIDNKFALIIKIKAIKIKNI